MSYPGDSSLSTDIQDRVLNTFDQTAKLAQEGKVQEAQLGCDFILRLDPHFEPAKALQGKLDGADGPVDLADIQAEPKPMASPEVLKTVALSPEEIEKLMAADEAENNGAESPAMEAEAPPVMPPPELSKPIGKVQIGSASELGRSEAVGPEGGLGGGDRIQQLLDEGQGAFDEEKYQEAIDSWSRIFLIDIDHAEATKRIDLARQLKEERERELEQIFHEGVAHADEGRTEEATRAFEKVLSLQPNHLAARELLDNLEVTEPEPAPTTQAPAKAAEEPPPAPAESGADMDVPPPNAAAEAPRQADESFRMVARAKQAPVSPFVMIGGAVAVLVAVLAFLLINNWGRLFPNSSDVDLAPSSGEQIARITEIYQQGEIEGAIAALEEIGSEDPDFLKAQRLVAQWQEELDAQAAREITGEAASAQADLVAQAREAYSAGLYLRAARVFTRASSVAPLSAAEAALFDDSKQQLEPIAQQIELYNQGQWELVLPPLWRRLEQDGNNRDVTELLINSYYNLALRDLRRGNPEAALKSIREVDSLSENDAQLARMEEFAVAYSRTNRDLLYDIFVQQLEPRR